MSGKTPHSTADTDGSGKCPVCGADVSNTLGRTCSSECAKKAAGIPKRVGWKCDLCGFSSTGDDAADDVANHLIEQHEEELTIEPEVVESVGLASVHTLCSRVKVPREQKTLITDGGQVVDGTYRVRLDQKEVDAHDCPACGGDRVLASVGGCQFCGDTDE